MLEVEEEEEGIDEGKIRVPISDVGRLAFSLVTSGYFSVQRLHTCLILFFVRRAVS